MSTKMKLVYFDARGRAELIRLILKQAGVDFEDQRVQFGDWAALKPKTPFGSLPYMEIDGKPYAESLCLARYIARRFNLMGKDETEALLCDTVLAAIDELRNRVIRIKFDSVCSEEQKAELKKKYEEEQLPAFLAKMEKWLTESKTGFFVGDKISMAELAVYDILENPIKENPKVLDAYPKLAAVRKTVEASPTIKAYLSTRKDTAM